MTEARRRAVYERIWAETLALTEREETPPAYPDDAGLFSLTFLAHPLPSGFASTLAALQSEMRAVAPFLAPSPAEKLHITLFSIHRDRPEEDFTKMAPESRTAEMDRVFRAWRENGPARVSFAGLNLTPDGTVLAQGFALDGRIDAFRAAVSAGGPSSSTELIHVTLARSLTKPDVAGWRRLVEWVAERRDRPWVEFTIEWPTFRSTQDRQGIVSHEAGQREVMEYLKKTERAGKV